MSSFKERFQEIKAMKKQAENKYDALEGLGEIDGVKDSDFLEFLENQYGIVFPDPVSALKGSKGGKLTPYNLITNSAILNDILGQADQKAASNKLLEYVNRFNSEMKGKWPQYGGMSDQAIRKMQYKLQTARQKINWQAEIANMISNGGLLKDNLGADLEDTKINKFAEALKERRNKRKGS